MNNQYDFSNQFAQPSPQYNFEDLVMGQGQQQGGQPVSPVFNGDPMEQLRAWMKFMEGQTALNRQTDLEKQSRNLQALSPQAQAQAFRFARDPVGAAISNREAQREAAGGFSPQFTDYLNQVHNAPPEVYRQQGNTAMNQWRKKLGTY